MRLRRPSTWALALLALLAACAGAAWAGLVVAGPRSVESGERPEPLERTEVRPTGLRVLLVGIDGMDWTIAGPMMREGRLPNLRRPPAPRRPTRR